MKKRLSIDELRASFERAEREASQGELTDGDEFFAELDRLDAEIQRAYEDCVIPDNQLSNEDREYLNSHTNCSIVKNEFFELRAIEKDISRARQYANTPDNRLRWERQREQRQAMHSMTFTPIRLLPGDTTERLSMRLGLEFPYDWSNSNMSESLLVMKALERYRFNDLTVLAFYFGLDQLHNGAQALYGDEIPRRLEQILNNIEVGFSNDENRRR